MPDPAADPDALLVEWARQDPQAFTALYDRHYSGIFGYCMSQLSDFEAAEDAASQTFMKALAALPRYKESGQFREWLYSIAHNVVLDEFRARHPSDPIEAANAVIDQRPTPEELALLALDQAWLDQVISRLSAEDRQVLELRRRELKGPKIAEILGISHEAAKKRQLRAVDRLRALIVKTPGYQEVLRGA